MRNHENWSISLGCWSGIYVRLHMYFLLFAAGTFYLSSVAGRGQKVDDSSLTWLALASLGILFASVIVHEIGHLLVANRFGGGSDEIVIGPLGGMAPMHMPPEPQSELITSLAGPLVNLAICGALCSPVLLIFHDDAGSLWGLIHPLEPTLFGSKSEWLVFVRLTFWINWMLFIVNLIPAYPFDGGWALRAAILKYWPLMDHRGAVNVVALVAKCFAILLFGASLVTFGQASENGVPAWFALLLLAIFIYFSAKQEEFDEQDDVDDEVPFGYDFSQGYTSLERSAESQQQEQSGSFFRWLEQRREARLKRQMELEAEEEKRVDEILARLHEVGMEQLSADERSLLQRVSMRYRNRQK